MKKNVKLVDFFVSRSNSPPYNDQKLFLKSHEKVLGYGDLKKILLNKKINKKFIIMKKAVVILLLLFSFSAFSQVAMINETECPNVGACFFYFCDNTFELRASLVGGNILNVTWFECIIDGNTDAAYSEFQPVGNGEHIINAPFHPLPPGNYYHRYWLAISVEGSGTKTAYANLKKISPPNVQLSASTSTICAGETVDFIASGGSNYEFKINGETKQNGSSNVFSTNLLNNDDVVVVEVSENGCSATSAPTVMTVNPLPDLTSITPSPTCYGDEMKFSYEGLTETGPWDLEFWKPDHSEKICDETYSTHDSSGFFEMLIPDGTGQVHLKITDTSTGCSNF